MSQRYYFSARLASSVVGGELADKMNTLVELLLALAWTVYFIVEAGVKLILPSHLFHKVTLAFNKDRTIIKLLNTTLSID